MAFHGRRRNPRENFGTALMSPETGTEEHVQKATLRAFPIAVSIGGEESRYAAWSRIEYISTTNRL